MGSNLLIVDDSPENLDILKGILKPHYALRMATNGRLALKIAGSDAPPDLILLDVMMPEMDGYEVCQLLKANERTRNIPVIFVTARAEVEDEARGFALGAEDYIVKPISAPVVLARVRTHLLLHDHSRHLGELVRQRTTQLEAKTRELEETRHQILECLGRAGDYRDNETGTHVLRMSRYVSLLARRAGLTEFEVDQFGQAALMHDIGKIGIPDEILRKPARLTAEEFALVKTHCRVGADIIGVQGSRLLQLCRAVALSHHERWDGKGYPDGLAGLAIPLAGRMAAIADVFDALTSPRPYKNPWTMEEALALIGNEAGHAFDPDLARMFVEMPADIAAVRLAFPDSVGEQP